MSGGPVTVPEIEKTRAAKPKKAKAPWVACRTPAPSGSSV